MKCIYRSFISFVLTCIVIFNNAWSYVVKDGENLSDIAHRHVYSKVYGKKGSLKKLLELNPQIKNPHLIKPGDEIFLNENLAEVIPEIKIAEEASLPEIAPSFKKMGAVALVPFYSMVNLAAKDKITGSESTVASRYYVGAMASYSQDWSSKFQTAVNLKLGQISFEKPTSTAITLEDTNKFISSLGLETNHQISERLRLKTNIDYGKELFLRAATTTRTTIDAVNIPSVGGKVFYDLKNSHPFILGVATSYKAKMPAKTDYYNVKLGHELGASLYLKQLTGQTQNSNIQTELGFTYRKQDTSITSQTETNIFLGVRFFFSGGGLK